MRDYGPGRPFKVLNHLAGLHERADDQWVDAFFLGTTGILLVWRSFASEQPMRIDAAHTHNRGDRIDTCAHVSALVGSDRLRSQAEAAGKLRVRFASL
jgi:hypothetical protein